MSEAAFDLVIENAHLATMTGDSPYGAVRDGAVGVRGDRIAWIGAVRDMPRDRRAARTLDAGGRWLTPGLVDCHTHLVYAGNRANEFAARLDGSTYADIAKAGGGIAATVRATRAATVERLVAQSRPRLAALAAEGVTTIEIKSGYGLDVENERKMLDAARAHGPAVKLHADQLSDTGGAALAAEFGALSADHLEYTNDAGIMGMAKAGTIAVMLPGAFHVLRETRAPPVASLRAQGVPMAVATDCNPGTSPVVSLVLMLNFACTLFRLTPEEA